MKLFSQVFTLFVIFLLVGAPTVTGQSGTRVRPAQLPFVAGEELTYEAKISKIIRGIAVADLIFTVTDPLDVNSLLVRSKARSKGTLLKLARYSFLQEIKSTIAVPEFRILKTVKHDVQKERVRDSEAVFDYKQRRVTYTEIDPREPSRPPRRIASELGAATHDLVSSIYSLRILPLAVGRKFTVQISDSGLVYDIPVRVTAKERQKTILGNVICFRLEADVFGPGRLIEKEGTMILWITDDARRVPVRSQVNAPVGRIEIRLKSARNLK